MFVRFSEFRGIYFYQDNQVAENEGTENKAHKTKQAQTYDDAENGDQRVNITNFLHQGNSCEIVDITGYNEAVYQ